MKKAVIFSAILILELFFAIGFANGQVTNCVEILVELNKKTVPIDSNLQILLVVQRDTLFGVVKNTSVCFPNVQHGKNVDLVLKLGDEMLVYPDLPLHFLRIEAGTSWLVGVATRPFDSKKYPFMKNMSKAYKANYLVVSSTNADTSWVIFKRRKNGAYILPDKELPRY